MMLPQMSTLGTKHALAVSNAGSVEVLAPKNPTDSVTNCTRKATNARNIKHILVHKDSKRINLISIV